MKAVLLAVIAAFLGTALAAPLTEQQTQFLFSRFVEQYDKAYQTKEFFAKYNTFKDNLNLVLAHNARDSDYKLAMNQFGDLTSTEFAALNKLKPVGATLREQASKANVSRRNLRAPESVDWSGAKTMNPVKNQASCGSCWAFSTVGTMESTVAISSGTLYDLSEQQLVDCSGSTGNEGCNGGLMDSAAEFIIGNGGLCEQKDYPYTAKDGSCKKSCKPVTTISSYKVLEKKTDAIVEALVDAPVAVALAASGSAFQFYTSGVITANCGTSLNHGVIAVGYGTDDKGIDYYKVRNSWGGSWGEKGYVRIQRAKNMCGIELHNWNVRMFA